MLILTRKEVVPSKVAEESTSLGTLDLAAAQLSVAERLKEEVLGQQEHPKLLAQDPLKQKPTAKRESTGSLNHQVEQRELQ